MNARDNYIIAMYALAKSAPAQWFEFVERFNAYTIAELERGIGTTSADMAISLGMGRRIVELRNDFRNFEELAKKIGAR